MMGDTVQVTRCTNCKAIYWVEDAPVLREVPYGSFAHKARKRRWYSFINLKSIMAATAPSPTPPAMERLVSDDYHEALKALSVAPDKDREGYLRLRIWWTHNQPYRDALKPTTPTEDAASIANLHGLLALLETSTEKGILLSAAALAALGRFGDARAILAKLNVAGFREEKKRFMQALEAEKGWLVALR